MLSIPMTLVQAKAYLATLSPASIQYSIVEARIKEETSPSINPITLPDLTPMIELSGNLAIIEAKYELALVEAEQKAFLAKVSQ